MAYIRTHHLLLPNEICAKADQATEWVYAHIFPDNKIYIGKTKDYRRRFSSGGSQYRNLRMRQSIKKIGWENIRHVAVRVPYLLAEPLERYLIIHLQTEREENGYNATNYAEKGMEYLPWMESSAFYSVAALVENVLLSSNPIMVYLSTIDPYSIMTKKYHEIRGI